MISVQNRLPEPGKENRVSITPDNGSAVEGVLSYADDATQEGTFWNRKTAQLLQGDIRTYPVREGQSISAGDVVNVGGSPETVYKDVVPQDNVENVIYNYSTTSTDIIKLNEDFSIFAYTSDAGNFVTPIRNSNGMSSDGTTSDRYNFETGTTTNVSLARLDDSHFVVQFQSGNGLYAKIGTVSGTNITLGNVHVIDQPLSNTDRNNAILPLSQSFALSIYNSSGIQVKVLTISGNQISTVSEAYSLSNNTGANYISACRLPDEGGNKRVCICFSDTGDGNKGKAVIATIDSNNVVTFGDVKTIRESTTVSVSCVYLVDTIYCIFATDIYALNESLMIVATKPVFSSYAANSTFLIPFDDFVIAVNGSGYSTVGNGAVYAKLGSSATIDLGDPYMFYGRSAAYCSGVAIAGDKALLAYADTQNSNYGTTTILEVSGNQIAGSFLDESKDAIALADGTGGQSIPVGFGGYCECSNVYEGEMIDSNGIRAVAVKNGWLHITPQYKNAAFGSFVYNHDAEPTKTVNLGFKPSIVLIYNGYNNTSEVAISGSPGDGNHIPMVLTRLYTSGNSYISDDGFVFYSSLNSSTNSNLYYVAFR